MAKAKKAARKAAPRKAAAKPAKKIAKKPARTGGALSKARKVVKKAAKAVKKAVQSAAKKVQAQVAPQPGVGSVCHVEFYAPDIQAAKAFWEQFLGLGFQPMGPNEYYFHGQTGWGPGGCLIQGEPNSTVAPVIYWQVDDIPAALAKAETLGATPIKEKTAIPGNHGYFAHFRTVEGNLFGLWSRN